MVEGHSVPNDVAGLRNRDRLLVAIGVACAAAAIATYAIRSHGDPNNAGDFTWYWRAGRAILEGQSPYRVINPDGPYPRNAGFLYPLPAALIAAPFALFPLWHGMAAFSAFAAGTLAFVMTRDGYWRLPLLMSFPMLWCVQSGQWTPLVVAAALSPVLACLAIAKPTIAAAAFAHSPTRRFAASATAILLLALALAPGWPSEYLAEIRVRAAVNYSIPFLVFPGPLLLLAVARWRRPEARLLLALACVPQTMLFYDQLPLLVLARSFREALVMAVASYVPIAVIFFLPRPPDDSVAATLVITSPVIVCLYYLPCLVAVLLRPNVGDVPAFVDRLARYAPQWLRGVPSTEGQGPG